MLVLLAAATNLSHTASQAANSIFSTSTVVSIVASAIVSGGLFAGIAKLRPERDLIIAQAADQAVETVGTLLGHMRRELADALSEVGRLKDRERDLLKRITLLEERGRVAEKALRDELLACQRELKEARDQYLALLTEHSNCGR